MIRLLNLLALIAVIASATWAYSVKYETILVAEKLRKREAELGRERDAVAVLKAEWQLLNRPARLQDLAKPESGMQTLSAKQVARATDIPLAAPDTGDKLDALLTGSLPASGVTTKAAGKSTSKSTGTTPAPSARGPGQASKTPQTASTAANTKTAASRKADQAKGAPVRLVPPGKVGPPTALTAAAPQPDNQQTSNPLTGFLKKLLR